MCIDWVSKKRLDKTTRCWSLWGQKKPAGIKLECNIFVSMETKKKQKNNQRTKLCIYILDTIESETTTRFKNRSSDRMMTSDWLVDVSDDQYTTNNFRREPAKDYLEHTCFLPSSNKEHFQRLPIFQPIRSHGGHLGCLARWSDTTLYKGHPISITCMFGPIWSSCSWKEDQNVKN
jgi:hypothetical protein